MPTDDTSQLQDDSLKGRIQPTTVGIPAKGPIVEVGKGNGNNEKVLVQLPSLLSGEHMKGETARDITLCNQYLRMGYGRSLRKMSRGESQRKLAGYTTENSMLTFLSVISRKFQWVARSKQYDANVEEERNSHAREVLNSGYAQMHKRVELLNTLVSRMVDIFSEHGLYGTELKGLGSGQNFVTVEQDVFRTDEMRQVRGLLDDLALETGGRRKEIGVSVSGIAGIVTANDVFSNTDEIEDAVWEEAKD